MQTKVGEHGESDEGHQTEAERERGQSVGDAPPHDRPREHYGNGHAPFLPPEATLQADRPHDRLGGDLRPIR